MKIVQLLFRAILIVFSGGILFLGFSKDLQRRLDARGLIPDQYRFGDLYNVSNLGKFKETQWAETDNLTESDKPVHRSENVDLYTIGDSFTTMDTSFYAGHCNRHIWLGTQVDTVTLDPARKSVLVIEVIERTIQERLREHFADLYIHRGFQIRGKGEIAHTQKAGGEGSFWENKWGHEINQRLEFLLFNSDMALKWKELKADLMLSWFGRTHPGSLVSRDRQFIFYEVEASPASVLSPFRPLTDAGIDSVVLNMNTIRRHYMNAGFSEVYICLIPNKVTVCEPGRHPHNNQIARIEQNPNLETPLLQLNDQLMRHPEWYHKSDGHWNVNGKRLWLRKVNNLIAEWSTKNNNP